MVDEATLREEYARLGYRDFVSNHVLDRVPYLFDGAREEYNEWRGRLADLIEVDRANIMLVGSSAVGISLNPNKGFREFGVHSDIDVGVVSTHHFEAAWRRLRALRRSDAKDGREWAAIAQHERLIYWGCVATDKILHLMPFGAVWQDAAFTVGPSSARTEAREIKFRIYLDAASLRDYHERNARKVLG